MEIGRMEEQIIWEEKDENPEERKRGKEKGKKEIEIVRKKEEKVIGQITE